jgi:tRNA-dihydrouridine synthase
MVAMAKLVVERVALPVTVKTRIGWGDEQSMPIVDIARRLEDVGVRALTVHCRTAKMGNSGEADWSWAQKAREAVSMPVIVNGDIRSAMDCERALTVTGCAGAMIGRRAMQHPWIFGEIRSWLDGAGQPAEPTLLDRLELCLEHLLAMAEQRGEDRTIGPMRGHYPGYLCQVPHAKALIRELNSLPTFRITQQALEREVAAHRNLPFAPDNPTQVACDRGEQHPSC